MKKAQGINSEGKYNAESNTTFFPFEKMALLSNGYSVIVYLGTRMMRSASRPVRFTPRKQDTDTH